MNLVELPIMNPDHHLSPEHNSGGLHDSQGQWIDSSSPFQSHHQSPVHEYNGFNFTGMPVQHMYANTTMPQQRSTLQQLQPLMMPPWPSMLTTGGQGSYPASMYHAAPMNTPIQTPISAPPATGRHPDRPRKTLTDADRRKMCQYSIDNPQVKQTEIGGI